MNSYRFATVLAATFAMSLFAAAQEVPKAKSFDRIDEVLERAVEIENAGSGIVVRSASPAAISSMPTSGVVSKFASVSWLWAKGWIRKPERSFAEAQRDQEKRTTTQ